MQYLVKYQEVYEQYYTYTLYNTNTKEKSKITATSVADSVRILRGGGECGRLQVKWSINYFYSSFCGKCAFQQELTGEGAIASSIVFNKEKLLPTYIA